MAREFPPNLDDGELWLPSEIIPDVGSLHPTSSGAAATGLEALAMELAAFRFFDPYPNPNKPPPAARRQLPYLAEVLSLILQKYTDFLFSLFFFFFKISFLGSV